MFYFSVSRDKFSVPRNFRALEIILPISKVNKTKTKNSEAGRKVDGWKVKYTANKKNKEKRVHSGIMISGGR